MEIERDVADSGPDCREVIGSISVSLGIVLLSLHNISVLKYDRRVLI